MLFDYILAACKTLIFITSTAPPTSAPLITSTTIVNPRSFTVTWNGIASVNGYNVTVSVGGSVVQSALVQSEGAATISYTFTGLVPYVYNGGAIVYETMVAAFNTVGTGPFSDGFTTALPSKLHVQ